MTSLQLKSNMMLGMKQTGVDPRVKSILSDCLNKLTKLQQERDQAIEEFMEEHAELKFKTNQDVKKKFQMKIALAKKQKDDRQGQQLEQEMQAELKQLEQEMLDKSAKGKSDVKDMFNMLAQKVQIDTQALVNALTKS